ncbi:endolytic transglycosylase MltG [Pseudoalteromonas luteoviolacea]|uniref:endolytic transglycosylase MltG n=1 Tax=Pseudoalteromonas luteoviolacea TaxID=43657 RepID=UPI001B383FF5|nr:endolytic transglycosylase MltG [Pseudoalteromonas luteoviolacea]MBQ4810988.1 endolytic transglycosylase MltG [Pseudoalteromonas luteoviolacea]
MIRYLLVAIVLVTSITIYSGYILFDKVHSEPLSLDKQYVQIETGQTFNRLCAKWQAEQALSSCWPYKIYSKFYPNRFTLKAGVYDLSSQTVMSAIIRINRGIKADFTFTIIEGESYSAIIEKLQGSDFLIFDIPNMDVNSHFQFGNAHPEGWLFPETYHYEGGTNASALISRAHSKMKRLLNDVWAQRAPEIPLKNKYEALILASIIEKESGKAAERATISSVFHNRLNKGMRLQTDPTVIYGLGERYQGDIKRVHLKEHTPYNTYRIDGLPPTPIAMPSKDALLAAVKPKVTDYFYFVSKGNGEHHFSKSLQEHNRAVRKYILNK